MLITRHFEYDVIIVGGGLGGAALGKTLAKKGINVLVLERETVFRDRVRGENLHPWGVAEAKTLGLYELILQTCGHEARYRINLIAGMALVPVRDMVATTPHQAAALHFYHPEMQEVMNGAAVKSGATVMRGAKVVEVLCGAAPSVRVVVGDLETYYRARLIVGADGRASACRKWAGFTINHDQDRMMIAGLLFNGLAAREDAQSVLINPLRSQFAFLIPLGKQRFRCYAGYYQQDGRQPLSGAKDTARFVVECIEAGAPAEWFASGQAAGPLASFNAADTWIPHPYQAGVALIGDAASSSDPSFGCGLALVLRDVRVLSSLLGNGDWEAASHAYAAEHDRYFGSIHRQLDWLTKLFYEPGPQAAARRERAFARIAEDPRRLPDVAGLGPEFPSDEAAYRNLFGDD